MLVNESANIHLSFFLVAMMHFVVLQLRALRNPFIFDISIHISYIHTIYTCLY